MIQEQQNPHVQPFQFNQGMKNKGKIKPDDGQIQLQNVEQQIQVRNKAESNQQNPKIQRVKSQTKIVLMGFIITLSAIINGYSLKQITSIPSKKLMYIYHIDLPQFVAKSILTSFLPIGCIFGALITKIMIAKYQRLTGIYIFTVVNFIAVILTNITTLQTLLLARFIQGIAVGYYSMIAPIYLKQIAPKQLRKTLGLYFSGGKVVGVLLVVVLELCFQAYHVQIGWRIILSMTAVLSVLQSFLIYFFCPCTPLQMLEKGKTKEARQIIELLYKQQYVQEIYNQFYNELQEKIKQPESSHKKKNSKIQTTQVQMIEVHHNITVTEFNLISIKNNQQPSKFQKIEVQKEKEKNINVSQELLNSNIDGIDKRMPDLSMVLENQNIDQNRVNKTVKKQQNSHQIQNNSQNQSDIFEEKKKSAFRLALHLIIIRNFTGGNSIIIQGGQFITAFDLKLGEFTPLIINSIQLVFIIFGVVYISNKVGKRPLFLFSILTLSFINIAVSVSMVYSNYVVSLVLMCIYMIVYGASFVSPIWSYPAYITLSSQQLLPNIFHWLGLAFTVLVPPLISGQMPNDNPYPVFILFGLYGFLSYIHVYISLKQSDGKTYAEIIRSFQL